MGIGTATFELVARHLFHRLAPAMPQLAFVEIQDESFDSRTRYFPVLTVKTT